MPYGPFDLSGLRILVVEDNLLLAEVVCAALESYGCEVVGPFGTLEGGLRVARDGRIDGALLDIRLGDDLSFPIAATLAKRGIPYLFLTGYDDQRLIPPEFRSAISLGKPVDPDRLSAAIAESCVAPAVH